MHWFCRKCKAVKQVAYGTESDLKIIKIPCNG